MEMTNLPEEPQESAPFDENSLRTVDFQGKNEKPSSEVKVKLLKELGTNQFGELTSAEVKLLEALCTGRLAQCGSSTEDQNDPNKAAEWTADRTIRSSLIRWLCTSTDTLPLIHSSGFGIAHARLVGELNLVGISVPFSLKLSRCAIPDGIAVNDAKLRNLDLEGTVCSYLLGWGLTLDGSLLLRYGFRSTAPVILTGASISRDVECVGAYFTSTRADEQKFGLPPKIVLVLDRAKIGGRIVFDEMKVAGIVHLVNATVTGPFDCNRAEITIGINLRDARARSMSFTGTKCPYLVADRVSINGSLFLRDGFCSKGTVVLFNSSISGDLDCNGSVFGSANEDTDLRLEAEKIFGKNLPINALSLNGSLIGGYVFLGFGFEAHGAVDLNGVNIGANLVCNDGRFLTSGKAALSCHFTHVRGAALFRTVSDKGPQFQTNGTIDFFGTRIDGSLSFRGAQFVREGSGVRLQNVAVGGTLQWKQIGLAPNTELNLSHSKVGQLEDDEASWPAAGRLILDGFSYDAIAGVPLGSRARKLWLKSRLNYLSRQVKTEFSLQPYRHLAETLRKSGYEDNARYVLIDMHKARREQGGFSHMGWLWSWILQGTIGFGFRSHRAFVWALFFVLVGAVFFRVGYRAGDLVPFKTETSDLTQFSSIGYSLDTFLPIINLHQEEFWIPSGYGGARWLQIYYWIHICLGWALITLGVAGFTGIIRKE